MNVKPSWMAIGLSCAATACFGVDRTYERRMTMMESGTYAGEWAELGEGVWLSLDEKGAGEFLLRGVRMAAEWTAEGDGRVSVRTGWGDGSIRQRLRYDLERDVLDMGFKGRESPWGNKGILRFVTEEGTKGYPKAAAMTGKAPDRAARLNGIGIDNPGVAETEDLAKGLPLGRVLAEGLVVETVDALYPQVVIVPDPWVADALRIELVYEGDVPLRRAFADREWSGRRAWRSELESEDGADGRARTERLSELLKGRNLKALPFVYEYGKGEASWRERGIVVMTPKGGADRGIDFVRKALSATKGERRRFRAVKATDDRSYDREAAAAKDLTRKTAEALGQTVLCPRMRPERKRSAKARPVEAMRAMMKESRYSGTWCEKVGKHEIRLSLDPEGDAVLDIGVDVDLKWTVEGEGKLLLRPARGKKGAEPHRISYDPETDTIDIGFDDKTPKGVSGYLSFESETLIGSLGEKARNRRRMAAAAEEADEEGRLKRMKEANDPRLRKVSSAEEIPSLEKIVVNSQCWKTTDGVYPKICIHPSWSFTECAIVNVRFGCYEASQGARKMVDIAARTRGFRDSDKPNTIGLSREQMTAFIEAKDWPKAAGSAMARDNGKGKKYWREDMVEVLLHPEEFARMDALLRDFVIARDGGPRYFAIEHFVTREEEKRGLDSRRARLKEKGLDLSLEERP
ncbi:MAG: hypothetical protein ACI4TC_09190 [Kiritimatiellia bacterium]